jgi:hypothetical protein
MTMCRKWCRTTLSLRTETQSNEIADKVAEPTKGPKGNVKQK